MERSVAQAGGPGDTLFLMQMRDDGTMDLSLATGRLRPRSRSRRNASLSIVQLIRVIGRLLGKHPSVAE